MLNVPRARLAAAHARTAASGSRLLARRYAKSALAPASSSQLSASRRKRVEPAPSPLASSHTRQPEARQANGNHQRVVQSPAPSLFSWIQNSDTRRRAFLRLATLLGMNRPRLLAGRRVRQLYYKTCAQRAEEEYDFWKEECQLPPTFQSWFTITNLHVWLLTTRLRALPAGLGDHHVQALLDHFFLDAEARMRDVCATDKRSKSATVPPTDDSPKDETPTIQFADTDRMVTMSPALAARRRAPSYYPIPTRGPHRKHAPEAFISRQMKAFREQYNGLTLALDLGLAHGSDAELAGAVWRNFLGARGRNGIAYPGTDAEAAARSQKDDGSGVREFVDRELDVYVRYPETMLTLVRYMRREVARLAEIEDDVWVSEPGAEGQVSSDMLFGPIKGQRPAGREWV